MELNVFKESLAPPKLVGWRESLEKLESVRRGLRDLLEKEQAPEFLPAQCFYIALLGELLVLKVVNDDRLNCPVPWNEETGFVSPPTFSADAQKAAELVGENAGLKSILKSFCGWQIFSREVKEGCACGAGMSKMRDVPYEVLVNHGATSDRNGVLIKQFFAIRSDDAKFLSWHFNNKNGKHRKPSDVLADTNIVWVAENQLVFLKNRVALSGAKLESAKEIYDNEKPGDSFSCGEAILGLSKEMEDIYERN